MSSLAEKTESDAAVAGIRRGMADAAGHEINLEDYLPEIAQEQAAERQRSA